LLGLAQALELGLGPIDFQRGDQSRGQPLGEVDQQLGAVDRRVHAQQSPARRLEVEDGLRDLEQDVIPHGLEIGLAGIDHAAGRQRGEDRVGEPDIQERTTPDVE
jgi:hypothetical protein